MGRLIDADLLKETLGSERAEYNCFTDPDGAIYKGLSIAIEKVNDAPTADDPLQCGWLKKGYWIKMRGMMPPEYVGLKECSLCGWHIHPMGRYAFDKREDEFRYCPHCGAKMDGERKDDE